MVFCFLYFASHGTDYDAVTHDDGESLTLLPPPDARLGPLSKVFVTKCLKSNNAVGERDEVSKWQAMINKCVYAMTSGFSFK
jgi:hypothetical protein